MTTFLLVWFAISLIVGPLVGAFLRGPERSRPADALGRESAEGLVRDASTERPKFEPAA